MSEIVPPETAPPEPRQPSGRPPLHRRFPALEKLVWARGRRVPHVQQTTPSDCGAASLTMVLAYYGKHMRLDDVRKVTGFGRDGADALALLNGGRAFGLRGRGVKVEEVEDLKFLPPASGPTSWTRRAGGGGSPGRSSTAPSRASL
jgi:Peptidase C39 family